MRRSSFPPPFVVVQVSEDMKNEYLREPVINAGDQTELVSYDIEYRSAANLICAGKINSKIHEVLPGRCRRHHIPRSQRPEGLRFLRGKLDDQSREASGARRSDECAVRRTVLRLSGHHRTAGSTARHVRIAKPAGTQPPAITAPPHHPRPPHRALRQPAAVSTHTPSAVRHPSDSARNNPTAFSSYIATHRRSRDRDSAA